MPPALCLAPVKESLEPGVSTPSIPPWLHTLQQVPGDSYLRETLSGSADRAEPGLCVPRTPWPLLKARSAGGGFCRGAGLY